MQHIRRENAVVVLQKHWRRHAAVSAYRLAIMCVTLLLLSLLALQICTDVCNTQSSGMQQCRPVVWHVPYLALTALLDLGKCVVSKHS